MKYGRFFFFLLSIFLVHGKFLRHDDTYTDDGINYRTEARSNNVDIKDQYVLTLPRASNETETDDHVLTLPRASNEKETDDHVLTLPRASNETETDDHVLTLPRASNENLRRCVCYGKENTTGIFFDVTIVLNPNEESF